MNKVSQSILLKTSSLVLLTLLSLAACEVDRRTTTRDPIVAEPLVERPTTYWLDSGHSNQIFTGNKFFLWKEPVSPDVAAAVIKAGDDLEAQEDLGAEPKARRQAIERAIADLNIEISNAVADSDDAVRDGVDLLGLLEASRVGLNPKTPEGAAKLEEIRAQIIQARADLGTVDPALFTKLDFLERLYDQLCDVALEAIGPAKRIEELMAFVVRNTEYFERMPSSVVFRFKPDGDVFISMSNWPKDKQNLSTDNGTIQNVRYTARGGVLRFDAITSPGQEFYKFRFAQNQLRKTDGRISYQGEMERYRGAYGAGPGELVQRGVAKLLWRPEVLDSLERK